MESMSKLTQPLGQLGTFQFRDVMCPAVSCSKQSTNMRIRQLKLCLNQYVVTKEQVPGLNLAPCLEQCFALGMPIMPLAEASLLSFF